MRMLTSTLLIAAFWAAWPAAGRADDDVRFIRSLYREYLQRTPSPDEVLGWRDAMDQGMSRRDVRAGFLASDELYDLHERDRSRLIRALFKHLAGRAPRRGEVDIWLRHWRANFGEDRLKMVKAFQAAVHHGR